MARNEIKDRFARESADFKAMLDQVTSLSQADSLLSSVNSLATEAASFGITIDVSGFEKLVEAKVKNFEITEARNSEREQNERHLKEKQLHEIIRREEEKAQEKIIEINSLYKNFEQNINKDIEWYKEKNKDLDKVTSKLKKDGVVDYELLDKHTLSHEKIKEKHEEHKQRCAESEAINVKYKQVHDELKDINNEIQKIEKQIKKENLTPEEIKELRSELEINQGLLAFHMPAVEGINQIKKQNDEKLAQYETSQQVHQEEIDKLGKEIVAHYKKEPEKYRDAKKQHQALQNQHTAIMSDGKIEDVEGHNKVLNKVEARKVASKVKEQIQGNEQIRNNTNIFAPSKTPNNNLPKPKTRNIII